MEALIVHLIGGAIGGNVAGALLKKFSLGTLWNSVVGILGGGLGGSLLASMGIGGVGEAGLAIGNIITNIISSGVGGGVLLTIVGLIKSQMAKS